PLLPLGPPLPDRLFPGVAPPACFLNARGFDARPFVPPALGDLLVELPQVRWRGHPPDPHPGPRLVDQVDGLVRQEPVTDVPIRQLRGGDNSIVGDRHAVMRLVAVPQPLQDLDRVRDRRLGHLDVLEPALQRGVLLQVLAVLIQRRGADRLQLAPGQHRLQDRGRVDRALRGTGADQGVQLVDEQDDVAAGPDLLEHLLQPLFEVTAVPGPRDQRAEVERVQLLVLEGLRHLALDDLLGQALHHGGLPYAGLSAQHRVVLGAPRQHLHHPLDLLLPADHRIELALTRPRGQVPAELVEYGRGGRRRLRRRPCGSRLLALVTVQQLVYLLAHP